MDGWRQGICIALIGLGLASLGGCAISRRAQPVEIAPPAEVDSPSVSAVAHRLPPATAETAPLERVEFIEPCQDVALPSPAPRSTEALPTSFWDLTLDEVLSTTLTNSQIIRDLGGRVISAPSMVPTQYDWQIVENDPLTGTHAAMSQFDASIASRFFFEKNDRAFNNFTVGGGAFELQQDLDTWQTEWGKTSWYGGRMGLKNLTTYDANNRINNLFPNAWDAQWQAELRQPLLQGAGRQFNEIVGPNARPGFNFSSGIVLARLNREISAADFELNVRRLVQDVQRSYWQLRLAYEDLSAREQTRDAANRTWQSIEAKAAQHLKGGEAEKEAEARAQYYYYDDLCVEALNGTEAYPGVYETERKLRRLMGLTTTDDRLIRPSDPPPLAPVLYDFDELLAHAIANRIELRQQRLRVRQHELRLVAAKNFLLPRLDATAQYRLRGFGDDLTGGGRRFASAYQDISQLDHQEWGFGLELNAPLGYRLAQTAVRQSSLQLAREKAIYQEQQTEIAYSLSNVVARATQVQRSLESAAARLDATRARVAATEAAFAADRTSLDLLLDAQEKHYYARQRYSQLQATYATALAEIETQSGRSLTVVD